MSLSVLIVDDNAEKAKEVAEGLSAVIGPGAISIVNDQTSAKRELRDRVFDLVILDITLPLRADDPMPQRLGGLDLLYEVLTRPGYKRPGHLVGLTAYEDVYASAAARFGNDLWSVVLYDRTSDAWLEQLKAKARHIIAAIAAQSEKATFSCDLCVVTALQEPELTALQRLDWNWKPIRLSTDATVYYEGSYRRSSGGSGNVIIARAAGMGMPLAAVLTMKMISTFRPRCVAMCGICAGNKAELNPGDIIAANPSWDYGSGKHSIRDKTPVFEPAPQPYSLSTRLRGAVERLQADKKMLDEIRGSFHGQKPDVVLRVHVGPLASGAAVLANQQLFENIKQQNRKILGVDMEGYGVMAASSEAVAPQPEAIILKGVSDFADESKDDRYRHYAAHTSANALRILAEEYGL